MVRRLLLIAALAAASLRMSAQEPTPAVLRSENVIGADGVALTFAWRYAAGDGAGWESPAYDDAGWRTALPALRAADLPPGDWKGVGWFRRHLSVSPELMRRPLALRINAAGSARVYLDGRLVIAAGDVAAAEVPAVRSDGSIVRLTAGRHLLAVRYAYPPAARVPAGGIGFVITVADPGRVPEAPAEWRNALQGAVLALPVFLALLHLALFAFDRRAKENLYYALEMLTFGGIVLREMRDVILSGESARAMFDRFASGLPIIAILFGAMTYYALRTPVWPKSWRAFLVAGAVLYPLSFLGLGLVDYLWIPYFAALVIEVVRIERSGRTVERRGTRFYLISFAIFGLAVVLQILVNFEVIPAIGGLRQVYVFGILASAVGMSLYLASTLGESRVQEAEHDRKTLELQQARDLQLSMLPRELPRAPGLDIAAVTATAAEVGGDYYDAREGGDGALLLAFGDATGHGLSAGIVVTAAKALFSSLRPSEAPCLLLAHCSEAMAAMRLPALRMCLMVARLSARRVTVASAAMPPLLIHRAATGVVEELGAGGLPLGSRIRGAFEEHSAVLSAGDTLLFASDGLAESSSPDERQLGYDGVARALRAAADAPNAEAVVQRLIAGAQQFRGARAQDDDITLLVVRVLAEEESSVQI